ncbi:DUF6804 family protein [Curtobacterium sp. VKM Ac-1376]|uniref:DUF6804 family protein n=1 Tax=Curtobacterium sp. VKM Ac-1376 TaxID=123312 RepID=UPI00188C9338|nr:DUF6804 family protein [Curtobacterium sp. VKM Ac-1376]MBF4614928.1 hypothetical protein [Curtobacterium sp. VKM Ac-1376]
MAARKGRPPLGSSQHGVPAAPVRPAAGSPSRTRETPLFTRPALAPSLIAAIVLLACVAIVDSSGFVFARWGVTVLALIVLVFSIRGKTWWASVLMAAVAVCWNPLATVPVPGQVWAALQLVAAVLFVVVGLVVKVPRETDAPRAS